MEASSLLRGERTPSTPARRRRGLVFLVVGLGACALLGARTRRGGGAARLVTEDEVDTTPKTTHTEPTGHVDASGVFETEVDLREREPVRRFLRSQGVNETSAEDELRTFLPRITVRLNEGLARGALGPQAAGGYLAFCLLGTGFGTATTWDSEQGQRRAAAYLIVMSTRGELMAARPADEVPTGRLAMGEKHGRYNRVFYNALKMRDPRTVLLGANYAGASGVGPIQLWDWVDDTLTTLADGETGVATKSYTSHDLQWVTDRDYARFLDQSGQTDDYEAAVRADEAAATANTSACGRCPDAVCAWVECSPSAAYVCANGSKAGGCSDKAYSWRESDDCDACCDARTCASVNASFKAAGSARARGARVWRPDATANSIYAVDSRTGEVIETVGPFDARRTNDINHFQVLDDGTAIVNGRVTGSFRKVELATGRTLWVCGGEYGNFTIVDLDGKAWAPKTKFLFFGQHNLEYFGDGEFLMFDNSFNYFANTFVSATSRPLRLQLDERAYVARITWAFETGVHSNVYGDADLMPTGHVVTCYWPNQLSTAMKEQFDARIVEVVPSTIARADDDSTATRNATGDDDVYDLARNASSSSAAEDEVAWEMLVRGHECTEPPPRGCARSLNSQPIGWSMYSVERFYLAPLVHSVRVSVVEDGALLCASDSDEESEVHETTGASSDDDGGADVSQSAHSTGVTDNSTNSTTQISFITYSSFKRDLPVDGTWRLERNDSTVAIDGGSFRFRPHWRATQVHADLVGSVTAPALLAQGAWKLVLEDEWGYYSRSLIVRCDAANTTSDR